MAEERFITPIAVEGNLQQIYIDGRKRLGAEIKILIQPIPEDPSESDPVKLRIIAARAPEIIIYGKRFVLSWSEYQFLKCVTEYCGNIAPGQMVYTAVYGEYSEVSDYQLSVIKCKLIKKLQDELGVKKIPKDWITAPYAQGFRLNMRRSEVEIV